MQKKAKLTLAALLGLSILSVMLAPAASAAQYCKTIDGKQYCYDLPKSLENCTQGPDGKFTCPVNETALNLSCDPVDGGYACWRPAVALHVPVELVAPVHCFSSMPCQVNCPEEDSSCLECKYSMSICFSTANLREEGNITFVADVIKKGEPGIGMINTTKEYPYDLNLRLVIDPLALPDGLYSADNCNVTTEENVTEMVCGPKPGEKWFIDAAVEKKRDLIFYVGSMTKYYEPKVTPAYQVALEALAPYVLTGAAVTIILFAFLRKRRRRK